MNSEPLIILLVEDDEGHASLIQRNLKRAGVINHMVHVKDGQEALDYLHCQGTFQHRQLNGPLLLVLDINLPRVDGIEVLRQVKTDPKHMKCPVIMLTTTDDPREIERCYHHGCNVYITKPIDYDAFCEALQRLGLFLQIVRIPCEGE